METETDRPRKFLKTATENLETLGRLTTPRLTPYITRAPTITQAAFMLLDDFEEVMFGGSVGGGKTYALLMAALQYADVPGYAAVIFRRTYPQLAQSGGLIERAHEMLSGTDARWIESKRRYEFPSTASLIFRDMESREDYRQYSGSEFQFVGLDQADEFELRQYLFMFSRLRRREGSMTPIRMRSTANPGHPVGHEWIKTRFIDSQPCRRIFIPSRLDDNPHLDRASYLRTLAHLDPITRRQLVEGDWTARQAGAMFRREWFKIVSAKPERASRVRAWDTAATAAGKGTDPDWTVGTLLARRPDKTYIVEDVRRIRGTSLEVEKLVKQTAELDGHGVPIRMGQEPGSGGKGMIDRYTREVLAGWNFKGTRETGDKPTRAAPVASMAQAGNIDILSASWNAILLDELESFPVAGHDDQVDSLSMAFAALALRPTPHVSFI